MASNHLKRLAMPRSWPLPRKTTIWVTRPLPGAHGLERCMPLTIVIGDVLGYARSAREVRRILNEGLCMIDGRVVKEPRRGVGLMDVLTLGDEHFRCVLDDNGKLRYRKISGNDASWKVCRIETKTTIKGGITQIGLHDGRSIRLPEDAEYSTGDSLKLSLPDQEVIEHLPFVSGSRCYLIGGSHVGELANVEDIVIKRSSMSNEVQFEGFGTIVDHAFVVSDSTPLPGVEGVA